MTVEQQQQEGQQPAKAKKTKGPAVVKNGKEVLDEMSHEELLAYAKAQDEKIVGAINRDLLSMIDDFEKFDDDKKGAVHDKLEDINRYGAPITEQAVYWLEDVFGRTLTGAAKLGFIAWVTSKAGRGAWKLGKAGVKLVTGRPAEAAMETGEAFQELAS